MSDTRTASCACGALRVETRGEPPISGMCSCLACQRRTGAPFATIYYWPEEQVTISGETKVWSRVSDKGRRLEMHFCPTCGSTVFWHAEFLTGKIGVAGGAFADPDMPAPQVAVWDGTRHKWLARLADLPTHQEQRF